MNQFLRHMPAVAAYSQRLAALQNVWDSLSLLSQMSGDGTNIGQTREAFESLSRELVQQLSSETAYKTIFDMRAKAQVAIDIMVRNLFERTADIGFLSTDDDIIAFMQSAASGDELSGQQLNAIRKRLKEYVAKYSVYGNIVLLSTDGKVIAQLDEHNAIKQSNDPIVNKALTTTAGYVEAYGTSDLLANQTGLIYAYRIEGQQRNLGVLCLCFRFEDETQAIFRKLLSANDWSVITFLDQSGSVIASSDVWQVPLHAKLEMVLEDEGRITRFAGREYLGISRNTHGYQGYRGPGWVAHVMVPLANAFEHSATQLLSAIDKTLLADAQQHATIFSEQLRTIPKQADHIQRELTKSVWNGNVNLVSHDGKENSFSKSLLREISATGRRTKEVFEQSIGDLHETVISAVLHDARFRASLAVEIMDRNLYERANDCRWWALNDTLRSCLANDSNADDLAANATQVLHKINQLYTVYDNIILFNRDCRVVAVSNPQRSKLCGSQLSQNWARETLALRDSQAFGVSAFEAFPAYNNQHCYIFTAAIHGPDHRILGGVAIVFDATPQFAAMLHDVLPLTSNGVIAPGYDALLLDHEGKVISATNLYNPGDKPDLPASLLSPPAEGLFDVAIINGHYCAVGARRCSGYREFKGTSATAVVIRSLGEEQKDASRSARSLKFTHRHNKGNDTIDLAVVSCGEHWLAMPSECVVEAIDDSMITRVPGRASWFSGVTRYHNNMLPVVDLSQWINSGSGNNRKSRAIVVIQDGDDMIGLAIDHLGDVLTVAKDEIVTMDKLNNNARTQLTPQVVRPRSADDSALLLLDVSALASMLNPGKHAKSA